MTQSVLGVVVLQGFMLVGAAVFIASGGMGWIREQVPTGARRWMSRRCRSVGWMMLLLGLAMMSWSLAVWVYS
jgi:multisubunit Na+/H+ antiporter MnhG subunit